MWDGEERRKKVTDHDMLIRIVEVIEHTNKNLERHIDAFEKHVEEDKKIFVDINKRIEIVNKYVFIGIGLVIAAETIIKFAFK